MKVNIYTREREIRDAVLARFLAPTPFTREFKLLKKQPTDEQITQLTDKIFAEIQKQCSEDATIQKGKIQYPDFLPSRTPVFLQVQKSFNSYMEHPEKLSSSPAKCVCSLV